MSNYYYIDIGVNFAGHKYTQENVHNILDNFYEHYGESVISISNRITEISLNEHLSKQPFKSNFYYTAGCHPHSASLMKSEQDYATIELALNNPKCLCVGEIGLDFNKNYSPHDVQIEVFSRQIKIAKKFNKPMYLHCRDAYPEFITLIKQHEYYNGVVHCFTGNLTQATELVNLGFKLGITCWLLDKRRNVDLVSAVVGVPLESLMVETDAPFMAPKGTSKSVPNDVALVVREIARLKGLDENECGKIIYETTKTFFKI